ncbi:peptidoglycan-binding protein [Myxococcota bacterium]|nr:peptidoglycan-binding protein [Myxococcota bacterium]
MNLSRGARGEAVSVLQEALVRAGYDIDVDGIFGGGTEAAVFDFQENAGLVVDGIVGPNTWAALGVSWDDEPAVRLLGLGAQGDDVVDLQNALVRAGYDIDVDGIFGQGTLQAVCDFQSNAGLTVDGIVGPNTWAALDAV